MKLRTGDPWMPAPQYSPTLRGLTLNLLVRSIERALPFHREVLAAEVVYSDPDFAALRWGPPEGPDSGPAAGRPSPGEMPVEWSLHADHTYDKHSLHPTLTAGVSRGVGAELRLHGRNPDEAEAAARRLGFTVLAPATDKPHGLREVYLLDADGYLWVPDVPMGAA